MIKRSKYTHQIQFVNSKFVYPHIYYRNEFRSLKQIISFTKVHMICFVMDTSIPLGNTTWQRVMKQMITLSMQLSICCCNLLWSFIGFQPPQTCSSIHTDGTQILVVVIDLNQGKMIDDRWYISDNLSHNYKTTSTSMTKAETPINL